MRYVEKIGAGGVFRTTIPGRLFLLESTGAAASVDVELLRSGSSFFNVPGAKRGLRVYCEGFDGLSIAAPVGTVVTFYLANEDVQISTTDGAVVSIPGGVVVTNGVGAPVPVALTAPVTLIATDVGMLSPNALAGVADVAVVAGVAGLIVAADAVNKEREVIVKNISTNAAVMRIAGATAAAGVGHELAPGESITLNTRAAVYAYCAVAQSVSVLVNTRV